MLAGYSSVQLAVFRAQVVDNKPIQSLHAVPFQAVEVLPDRVVAVLSQYGRYRVVYLFLSGQIVVAFQPYAQVRVVSIRPLLRGLVPRQPAHYGVSTGEVVVYQVPGQRWIILQDQDYISDRAL